MMEMLLVKHKRLNNYIYFFLCLKHTGNPQTSITSQGEKAHRIPAVTREQVSRQS